MNEWTEPKYCLGCNDPISMCQCSKVIYTIEERLVALEKQNKKYREALKKIYKKHKGNDLCDAWEIAKEVLG